MKSNQSLQLLASALLPLIVLCAASPTLLVPAQAKETHPINVQLSLADESVMAGEPLLLRWRITPATSQHIYVNLGYREKNWVEATLVSPSGQVVSVADPTFVPESATEQDVLRRGRRVGPDSAQAGELVLRPQWRGAVTPGDYTLNVRVQMPYAPEGTGSTRELKAGAGTVLRRTFDLPIKITRLEAATLRNKVEALWKTIQSGTYEGSWDTLVARLFAFPEAYGGATWRKIINRPQIGDRKAVDSQIVEAILKQLVLMRTPEAANILAEMGWVSGGRETDWRWLGTVYLANMYVIADPSLRQHIEGLFLQYTGKVPSRERLERGLLDN